MKSNSEEAIGRVLAGLRNVKPSLGMEHRIMEAVERRAAAPHSILTNVRFHGARPLPWALALGGLLVLVSFSFTSHRTMHQTVPIDRQPGVQAELQAPPRRPRSLPYGSPALAHAARPAPIQQPQRSVLPVPRSTRAASQPAPVAPLTQEEKLLLRIAHTGDPREMAMLNPEIRSQQAADTEAQFKRFVEQSSKGDQQ